MDRRFCVAAAGSLCVVSWRSLKFLTYQAKSTSFVLFEHKLINVHGILIYSH